jgi:uncharacterized protein (TIGR03083 family)
MTTAPATDVDLRDAVAAELNGLAGVLDTLPVESWDLPSLCAGWRVREAVAHLTMPGRCSTARFVVEIARSRGDFDRMADRTARRDATLPTGDLVAVLRSRKLQTWKPPGGGYEGALIHAAIHGLDITTALNVGRRIPEHRLRLVLDGITKPMSIKHFGVDVSGVRFSAEDMEWSFGSGAALSGEAQDLALVLCGRAVSADRLHGEAAARFVQP